MTKKNSLRWGIIGCGKHATKVMIPAFSSSSCSLLSALASTSKHSALKLQHPESVVYDSYQSLLDDPQIEAVYVGLPNHLHAEWTIRALKAGKHVLCDKPLALSCSEVAEIARVAAATRRRYAEGFMYRFHPQYEVVRKILREELLGEVRLVEGHFHYSLQDYSNIRWQAAAGGGALRDVGCYIIDAAHFLFPATSNDDVPRTDSIPRNDARNLVERNSVDTDRPETLLASTESGSTAEQKLRSKVDGRPLLVDQTQVRSPNSATPIVSSATAVLHPTQGVDEFVSAQLLLAGGPVVHLTAGCNLPRRNTLALFGTKGILELDRAFIIPRNAKARLKLWRLDSEQPELLEVPAANQYSIELDTFSRACCGESVDESLFSDGRVTAQVISEISSRL